MGQGSEWGCGLEVVSNGLAGGYLHPLYVLAPTEFRGERKGCVGRAKSVASGGGDVLPKGKKINTKCTGIGDQHYGPR